MRMNLKWSWAALALAGALGFGGCDSATENGLSEFSRVKATPCEGKCDGPGDVFISEYTADIAALNERYPGPTMEKVEDAFVVHVDLGAAQFAAPTHLFGKAVNVIPYSNTDQVADATGAIIERGDEVIAQAFGPGIVGYSIKHHRPEYRTLSPADLQANIKEQVKLQDTHIQIVVGVVRDGKPGAITLNNPQTYEDGLFGDEVYSMIFVKPKYPEYLNADQVMAFNDNILLMTMGFNAVSNFPGDYNGGDPLAAHSIEKLREHVRQMVLAIGGDQDAIAFFQDPANQVYCAELAFLGASAGMHFPLNAETMIPLVGEEAWGLFLAEVEKSQAGEPNTFITMNDNPKAPLVALNLPPEDLKPAPQYAPNAAEEAQKLAFKPMTMADIVEQFLRTHVPREQMGESIAPVQGNLLSAMKPGLLEAMAMDQIPAEDPRRQAVDQLFEALVGVVSTSYGDYAEFQQNLAPLMAQARQVTGPRDDSGTGYFVPPSIFHVVAQGKHKGILGLDYVGHGLHASVTKKIANVSQEEEEDPGLVVVEPENPFAGSCQAACGGSSADGSCWCDTACAEYGDCCSDIQEHCAE